MDKRSIYKITIHTKPPNRITYAFIILSQIGVLFMLALYLGGCAYHELIIPAEQGIMAVRGNHIWTSTGITIDQGQKILIEESDESPGVMVNGRRKYRVGARGSYLINVERSRFPLEPDRANDDRRFPGYCLMARIREDGVPFYIGSSFKGISPDSGELWLGINDPEPQRNYGEFWYRFSTNFPDDVASTEISKPTGDSIKSIKDPNVVIFFIDGLRPDALMEMAHWGHMPNFSELFLKNGVWVQNSFTVLPSMTITCFSSMISGLFSNRHGIKMQCYYDRNDDKFIDGLSTHNITRFSGEVKQRRAMMIYDYFPNIFGCGAMPFERPEANTLDTNLVEWLHRAINKANYASNIKDRIDAVQTRFALDLASSQDARVMLVWLPANDVISEKNLHGQFGGGRQTIANVDESIGKIIKRLKIRNRFENSYFILVSDHGHAGGPYAIEGRYDVMREVFHARLAMNVTSMWHQFVCPGAPADRIGYVSDSDGVMGIFLPQRHVDSGDLSAPNTFAELADYGLADGSRLNALELFAEYTAQGRWPLNDIDHRPVDFAVAMVDEDTVLVHKTAECQALIHARRNMDGILEFKYEPVRKFSVFLPIQHITDNDPLGYLTNPSFLKRIGNLQDWLAGYHTGSEWLKVTCDTKYPACIDALNLFFRWDGPKDKKSPTPSQPDILLFANKGWIFEPELFLDDRYHRSMGTRHGMAFREATHICLFVSGPGIRKGAVVDEPHRILDIMPTVLEMMGKNSADANMDGRPIREIWESNE